MCPAESRREPLRPIDPSSQRLRRSIEQIRAGRALRRETVSSIGEFLPAQFKREYERPFRKLGAIAELWQAIVPADLAGQAALASFNRGLLTVQVPDSSVAYDLERTLAAGAEQRLRQAFRGGTLRRVRVVVNPDLKIFPG